MLIFSIIFAAFVLAIVDLEAGIKQVYDNKTVETCVLESVAYQDKTIGSFTLGFGKINSKSYYVCNYIQDDGGIGLLRVPADKTVRYKILDADEEPYAEITRNGLGGYEPVKLYLPKDA